MSPFFHSILCNHQLPHTATPLFFLSGDSNGICLVSKRLVEVVQAAAGLDSGNEQHRSQDTFVFPRGLLVAQGARALPAPPISVLGIEFCVDVLSVHVTLGQCIFVHAPIQ